VDRRRFGRERIDVRPGPPLPIRRTIHRAATIRSHGGRLLGCHHPMGACGEETRFVLCVGSAPPRIGPHLSVEQRLSNKRLRRIGDLKFRRGRGLPLASGQTSVCGLANSRTAETQVPSLFRVPIPGDFGRCAFALMFHNNAQLSCPSKVSPAAELRHRHKPVRGQCHNWLDMR